MCSFTRLCSQVVTNHVPQGTANLPLLLFFYEYCPTIPDIRFLGMLQTSTYVFNFKEKFQLKRGVFIFTGRYHLHCSPRLCVYPSVLSQYISWLDFYFLFFFFKSRSVFDYLRMFSFGLHLYRIFQLDIEFQVDVGFFVCFSCRALEMGVWCLPVW